MLFAIPVCLIGIAFALMAAGQGLSVTNLRAGARAAPSVGLVV